MDGRVSAHELNLAHNAHTPPERRSASPITITDVFIDLRREHLYPVRERVGACWASRVPVRVWRTHSAPRRAAAPAASEAGTGEGHDG